LPKRECHERDEAAELDGHEGRDRGLFMRLYECLRDSRQAADDVLRSLAGQIRGNGEQRPHDQGDQACFLQIAVFARTPASGAEQQEGGQAARKRKMIEHQVDVRGVHRLDSSGCASGPNRASIAFAPAVGNRIARRERPSPQALLAHPDVPVRRLPHDCERVRGHRGRVPRDALPRPGRTIDIVVAAVLVPVALVFDFFDGRVARHRHEASMLGREMDSLADVISFGVAPAAIAFALGLTTGLDQAFLTFFVVCGVSRLARYNVTADELAGAGGKVTYYEGTPIPTSVVPLVLVLAAAWSGHLMPVRVFGLPFHLPALLFVASGSLMISTIRIPKP
jgi:CDP-diacylglycerol--serine O-phosphatidyltransferase